MDSELFHNHHVGCMTTQMLIWEVEEKQGDQLQVLVSTKVQIVFLDLEETEHNSSIER